MKKLLPIILLLFSWVSLQAQTPIRYPGLSANIDSILNAIVLPGKMDTVMAAFVEMGLAFDDPGSWSISIIDSMSFDEDVVFEDVGPWGWLPGDGTYIGYPFKNGIAQRPKYLEYTQITINKANKRVSVVPRRPEGNPARGFLEGTFPEGVFPSKAKAEKRRNDKIKEKEG